MNGEVSIIDAAQFILKNRGNSYAFKNWSELEICRAIKKAVEVKSLVYTVDSVTKQLNGIGFGIPYDLEKRFHVVGILLTKKYLIRDYINTFLIKYPGWSISGFRRHGKYLDFTKKLNLLNRI